MTVKWFFLTITMFYSEELWCIRFKPSYLKNTRGNCWSMICVNTLQLSQFYPDLHYIAKLSRYLNHSLISSLRWAIQFIGLFHSITTKKHSKLQYNNICCSFSKLYIFIKSCVWMNKILDNTHMHNINWKHIKF